MIPWLARFKIHGLDNVHLVDCHLAPVSETFCLCHLTFEIRPRNGDKSWRFLNIYGLRQDDAGQRFEFAVSDNEMAGLLEHCPSFMDEIEVS
jgi:hypothetical protein